MWKGKRQAYEDLAALRQGLVAQQGLLKSYEKLLDRLLAEREQILDRLMARRFDEFAMTRAERDSVVRPQGRELEPDENEDNAGEILDLEGAR